MTRAELLAYLHEDALSHVPAGAETGSDEQLFPDGLLDWPDEVIPPGGPLEGGGIGLAVPLFDLYATGDPERPWNLQITGGRIWIDPTRTEGDERLGVIAHELIHVLGRAHPDPTRFPDTIMVAGGGDGPTLHILHPLDRAALFAVYSRVEPGGTPDAIEIDFGPWADTSTHLYGVLGLADGEIAFGAAFLQWFGTTLGHWPGARLRTRGESAPRRNRALVWTSSRLHTRGRGCRRGRRACSAP